MFFFRERLAYKHMVTFVKSCKKVRIEICSLERFSIECRKKFGTVWFCIATVCDWLKILAPLSRLIVTNRDLPVRVFPRSAQATCICFDF